MSSSSADDLVFHGIDGDECDRFVAAITQAAFQEKKMRDQEWMADLALAGLRGIALRWYTELDEDVQGNWRLLRKALVRQYPHADTPHQNNFIPIESLIPTPAAAPPPLHSADGSSSISSAGKEHSHTNLLPPVGHVSLDSTIPTPAAASPLQTPSSSSWSVVKSEPEHRNSSSNYSASASSESLINSFRPVSTAQYSPPAVAGPVPPNTSQVSNQIALSISPWTTPKVGMIKVLTEDPLHIKYVPRSHYGSIMSGWMKGTLIPTQSTNAALLVNLMPPDAYSLRTMELCNYNGSAKYLGLKWYEEIPDPSITSNHESALIPLTDTGKGDDLMSCKLPSLYWSGPTRHNIWLIDQSTMKLTPTYRNPFEGVMHPLEAVLRSNSDFVNFPIEMVPNFDLWKGAIRGEVRGMKAELIFVPL